ncbi:recombinase family protein [Rufibacter soli]
MIKVAIYVRVSSKRQDYQRQISELLMVAEQKRFEVVKVFREIGSASKRKRAERPELLQLMEMAATGAIQKILVSEISRLGRKTSEMLDLIERLSELKVSVYAKNLGMETLLDTGRRNPGASIVFTILAELARVETEELSERIKSGLEEARRNNKQIGRPSGSAKPIELVMSENPKVVKYLKQGKSIRETAKLADVSTPLVQKIKKALTPKIEVNEIR